VLEETSGTHFDKILFRVKGTVGKNSEGNVFFLFAALYQAFLGL